MYPMRGTDTAAVTVTHVHEDVQVWPAHFDAFGNRERATVQPVETVGAHVVRKTAGTSYARDKYDFLERQLLITANALYRGENCEIATARAPAWHASRVVIEAKFLLGGVS
jgi:hypothetical protein